MDRIGILGGSFDPVHLGHICLAQDAMKQAGLCRVIFVPVNLQPFKLTQKMTAGEDRINMLRAATADLDGLEVSDYELRSDRISYTYLTMRAMKRIWGEDSRLFFITGTDTFLKIETWKNAKELLTCYSYIIGTRPGYRQEELESCIARVRRDYNTEVRNINNVQMDVSSTEIRRRLETGTPAGDLIPDQVERYIRKHGLYRQD